MSDINYEAYPEYASYGDWEDLATAQKKEIERLQKGFADLLRVAANDASEYQAEIERLRGLLRECLPHFERGQPILWKRVREALGDV